MSDAFIIARYILLEAVRRRTFHVVSVITGLLLLLYAWGAHTAFSAVEDTVELRGFVLDAQTFVGNQLTGVTVFAEMFLGAVLAVLLSQSAIRGDAETGLLQPIVARPVGRRAYIAMRFLVVGGVVALFVVAIHLSVAVITGVVGDWWPPSVLQGALYLALAMFAVTAVTVVMSVFLGMTANGIAVFLLFGVGMTNGMLMEIGSVTGSAALEQAARIGTWVFPFEPLYQAAVHASSRADSSLHGLETLGPFSGGRPAHSLLIPWAAAYCAIILHLAAATFRRRDL